MTYRTRLSDLQLRERRQRDYSSSGTVASRYPGVDQVVLELRFTAADRKPLLSPYKQLYSADMQAFFQLQCPLRSCLGGGFDLSAAVTQASRDPQHRSRGVLQCRGVATGSDAKGAPCPVEMTYDVALTVHAAARSTSGPRRRPQAPDLP